MTESPHKRGENKTETAINLQQRNNEIEGLSVVQQVRSYVQVKEMVFHNFLKTNVFI